VTRRYNNQVGAKLQGTVVVGSEKKGEKEVSGLGEEGEGGGRGRRIGWGLRGERLVGVHGRGEPLRGSGKKGRNSGSRGKKWE